MKVNLNENGKILSIINNAINVPFLSESHFGFGYEFSGKIGNVTLNKVDNGYFAKDRLINYYLSYDITDNYVKLNVKIENASGYDFAVEKLYFNLAIDSYMEKYPDWREKYFPTLMRLEKTHFYGYFQSPNGSALAIVGEKGIPSYDISYAHPSTPHLNNGHRIYNTTLHLFNNDDVIERAPINRKVLKNNEVYENAFYLIPLENLNDFEKTVNSVVNAPIISAEKYTVEKNEELKFNVIYNGNYTYSVTTPNGEIYENKIPTTNNYGLYKLNVYGDNGYVAESLFFVRKSWDFYLLGAAQEALNKPQKASTHTESWYGYFSLFLAQKHYPNLQLYAKALESFNEVMPLCFSFEKALPLVIPKRVQNTALFISLLVDLYEADVKNNLKYLQLASLYGNYLIDCQSDDGAYRRGKIHYTCVIYIAKSMLELVKAERTCNDKDLNKMADVHYQSAKKAIDELVLHLDNIDTEGELTFEDGMISCSALQIAYFALTLPENERKKYVEAAEFMIKIHACLEQQYSPDCRTNGGSLRFWESQYDVMVMGNTINSPHGWSAWTLYAYYYLFALTGKKFYLTRLMNGVCACAQLLSLDGNLRWAFFSQPYVKYNALVPDETKPIKDGNASVDLDTPAYRGKYVVKTYGESYVDMISGWFRTGNQKITGGYSHCPLITESDFLYVDNQGGCCDNDVHEIFKCIEETVLKKAFIYYDGNEILTYGGKIVNGEFVFNEEVNEVVYSLSKNLEIKINGKEFLLTGVSTLKL